MRDRTGGPRARVRAPCGAARRDLDVCGEDHIGEGHRAPPEGGGPRGSRGEADRGRALRDILSMQDAGAEHIFDFVDAGLPSTVVRRKSTGKSCAASSHA